MDDRELVRLAAKAASIPVIAWLGDASALIEGTGDPWCPLDDDGDALRLAVQLGFAVRVNYELGLVFCTSIDRETYQASEGLGDPYAATRRAIVRTAAATAA